MQKDEWFNFIEATILHMMGGSHLGISAWRAPVDEAAGFKVALGDLVLSYKTATLVAHQDEHDDSENR